MQGEGDQTFVLLPRYLTGSPKIDFELLINELSKDARVVVVEPFGYGLSDDTETPRTVENMVEEIHAALASLDIDTYALVTHSIWEYMR
ncbi:alpha/beta hydrolase [Erysipelothrix sp. D19-032]